MGTDIGFLRFVKMVRCWNEAGKKERHLKQYYAE